MRVSTIAYTLGLMVVAAQAAPEKDFDATLAKHEAALELAARAIYDHLEANQEHLSKRAIGGERASWQFGNGCISRNYDAPGLGAIYKRQPFDEYGGGGSEAGYGGDGMSQQGMGGGSYGGGAGMGQQGMGGAGMGQQGMGQQEMGGAAYDAAPGKKSMWGRVRNAFGLGGSQGQQMPKPKSNVMFCLPGKGTNRHNQLAQGGGQGLVPNHMRTGMNGGMGGYGGQSQGVYKRSLHGSNAPAGDSAVPAGGDESPRRHRHHHKHHHKDGKDSQRQKIQEQSEGHQAANPHHGAPRPAPASSNPAGHGFTTYGWGQ